MGPDGNLSKLDSVPRLNSDVRFRQIGDEGIAVKQSAGEVVVVSEVGAQVMRLIDGRRSLAQIIETLQNDYDVATDTLADDVQKFVRELVDNGIAETGT